MNKYLIIQTTGNKRRSFVFIRLITAFLFTLFYCLSFGQNNDSLYKIFNNSQNHDTIRLKAIDDISWNYLFTNPDSAIIAANAELKFAKQTKQKEFQAYALNYIGTGLHYKAKYPQALIKFFESLKLQEEIKNTRGAITAAGNIANLYLEIKEYDKALIYIHKCFELLKGSDDKKQISTLYANRGLLYHELKQYKKSLEDYLTAIKIQEEINFKEGVIVSCINIGNIYQEIKEYDKALLYLNKSLKLSEKIGYKQAIGGALINISVINESKNDFKAAIVSAEKSIPVFKEISDLHNIQKAEMLLSNLYEKIHNPKMALEHYKAFIVARDSIFNEDNTKSLVKSEMNFEFEKKQVIAKARQEKKDAIREEELRRQKAIRYAFTGGFVLVLIMVLLILRSYRQKQKTNILLEEKKEMIELQKIDVEQKNEELNQQNEEISSQRDEIEKQKQLVDNAFEKLHEKNKEVMDSIKYASRIQRALLTNEKYIEKHMERLNN